ncbi:MAG: UvrD-helicase domain-containing protein [Pseudomonadales bacterium]|jgi:DNA helicase-2/ATP-dependent DNA helicase PcrA|nr:UvrD-helicase domain-containing protein [Pseudomonadales bacterium]
MSQISIEELIKSLNDKQELAVLHRSGPALVLAGAGSGKTKVLTTRAAHLIANANVKPSEILLVTFTNKAAAEMKSRVHAATDLELPLSGTFHSISAKILRRYAPTLRMDNNFTIYDSDDQLSLMKAIYKEHGWNVREYKPSAVLGAISGAKNKLWSVEDYKDRANSDFTQFVGRAFDVYTRKLREEHAVDFDDLLNLTVQLFKENKEVLGFYQEQLKHVLVDEYQDTNKAQYTLTKMLTSPQNNLFAVGDFSQSIYAWRGADYKNMMLLEKDFKDLQKYDLDQNYRSHQNILSAATQVIEKNTDHPILSLWTAKKEMESLVLFDTPTTNKESETVVDEIKKLTSEDYSLNDIAILYRTNAQSRSFEEALTRRAIPYKLVGGFKFYERKEIKDVLAYLRLYINPRESVSLARALKIGKRRFRAFEDWRFEKQKNYSDDEERLPEKPYELLKEIVEVTKYKDMFDKDDLEDIPRLENIDELLVSAAAFDDTAQFLENIALIQDEQTPDKDLAKDEQRPQVTLMSLHSAKGLEFPVVFLVGMEEGLLPHSRSLFDMTQLAEERRLTYVGITRAKEKLYFSYARKRWFYGTVTQSVKSRFLDDIDPDILDVKEIYDNEVVKMSPFKQGFYGREIKKQKKMEKPLDGGRKLVIDDALIDNFLSDDMDIETFLKS